VVDPLGVITAFGADETETVTGEETPAQEEPF
jgi:hypothetical protein